LRPVAPLPRSLSVRRLASALAVLALIASPAKAALAAAAAPAYVVSGQIAGPDGSWDYASFDPAHHRLYVSRGDGVMAVDVDSGAVTPHLTAGQHTHEPLVLPGGDLLLVTNGASNLARVVKTVDGSTAAEIPATKPDGAVFDPASGLVVTSSGSGLATVIDPAAKTATGQISVAPGQSLEFPAVDGQGGVFDNVESLGEIVRLDLKARTVLARYRLAGCEEPGGLAYIPGADVLISACQNGVAEVVSAKTGVVVASLAIGKGPDAVIWDGVRRLAFIPCGKDGVLDVIAPGGGADAAVVEVVKTEAGARTGAVDPETGKLYLPTARFGPAPAAGGKPPMVPGSFHILVVSPQG